MVVVPARAFSGVMVLLFCVLSDGVMMLWYFVCHESCKNIQFHKGFYFV